ncbi:hypothetical protein [Desulforamulus aeronauticus]|nr:hypothetical protein [Desulforamulus aeronauticus]
MPTQKTSQRGLARRPGPGGKAGCQTQGNTLKGTLPQVTDGNERN